MFWKLVELIVRVVFFRRFRKAAVIGRASDMLVANRPEEALALLDRLGMIHRSLLPLYAFTRGKILEALGDVSQAESAYRSVVLMVPEKGHGDMALAILAGRQFQFDECRQWLQRAIEKRDPRLEDEPQKVLALLDDVVNGSRLDVFDSRARQMAQTPVVGHRSLRLPLDVQLLAQWISNSPEQVRAVLDDVALLLGQSLVMSEGGQWKVALAIEDSVVIMPDGEERNPFAELDAQITQTENEKQK